MDTLGEHILEWDSDGAASLDRERSLRPGGEAVAIEGDGVVPSRRGGERERALGVPQVGGFKGHLDDRLRSRGRDGPVYVEVCAPDLKRRRRGRRGGRKRVYVCLSVFLSVCLDSLSVSFLVCHSIHSSVDVHNNFIYIPV